MILLVLDVDISTRAWRFLWSLEDCDLDEGTRPTSVVKHYLREMWFHASYTIADDRGNTGMGMEFTSICKNSHWGGVILAYYPRKAVTSYAMLEIGTDCGSYMVD